MKTLCLNMIVKNESAVIVDTLKNLISTFPALDYYCITDTGSTDNTISLITNTFNAYNIAGEIFNDQWIDFATNRTLSLIHCAGKSKYILINDADDRYQGKITEIDWTDAVEQLQHRDALSVKFGPVISYERPLILNNYNTWHWKFKGVLHEYLCKTNASGTKDMPHTYGQLNGDYFLIHNAVSGNRTVSGADGIKYERDIKVLTEALTTEKDINLCSRYTYYLAQSYRDYKDYDKAIYYWKQRITTHANNGYKQECYYSCIQLGLYLPQSKEFGSNTIELALSYWMLSSIFDSERLEGTYYLMNYYRKNNEYDKAVRLYTDEVKISHDRLRDGKNRSNKLFVFDGVYDYLLDFEMSISCYYSNNGNDRAKGLKHMSNLFNTMKNQRKIIPPSYAKTIKDNFKYYVEIASESDVIAFANFTNYFIDN